LILWTLQYENFWNNLQRDGIIKFDKKEVIKDKTLFDEFQDAYKWMREQMCLRIPNSPTNTFPFWAWERWWGYKRKPDLRSSEYRDWHGFRIEFEIPDELVLLSDFDLWHSVLNNLYLPNDPFGDVDNYCEIVFDTPHTKEEIEESWQRIFNIELEKEQQRSTQACFWEIKLDWVKGVTEFGKRFKD